MSDGCCCSIDETNGQQSSISSEKAPSLWRDVGFLCSIISGALWLPGALIEWLGLGEWPIWIYGVALLVGAYTFVPKALRRLVRQRGLRRLGIGLLMTIAAVGAVFLGHVGEAAALAFLFSISETLEERAMRRARRSLSSLLALIPDTAQVIRLGKQQEIPVKDIVEGEILVIGAGERIPTDGVVVTGKTSVNNSALTGESIPIEVEPNSPILAGAINGAGVITVRATARGEDNSLTQIVHLVEQAQANKGTRARLADRIAAPLVPIILVVACAIAGFGFVIGQPELWIERALVVLVAASPCALALAVPVTVISAIGAASKLGVVFKSGAAFEEFGTIRTVVFDKTGTLTQSRPEVVSVHTCSGFSREQVCEAAAALEIQSKHPLADAVVAQVGRIPLADQVVELSGFGLQGLVNRQKVRVGSPRWIESTELEHQIHSMTAQGMVVIVVEIENTVAGLLGIRDELRPEVSEVISTLHQQGLTTVMLTGDHKETAQTLAAQAGITTVYAEQLPATKAERITELRAQQPTAMLGDGTNDAPALAAATIGIAMGATGTAAAVESADIAFTGTDLRLFPKALAHARRGRTIMVTNIALALLIILGLFPLALFGILGLTSVVLIHEIAEVVIILLGMQAAKTPQSFAKSGVTASEPTALVSS